MPREPKPNTATIRYDREDMIACLTSYMAEGSAKEVLNFYEAKRTEGKDKPCQVRLWHGPGHQSSTFCEVRGEHEKNTDLAWDKHWPEDAEIHFVGNTEFIEADPYARDY